MAFEKGKTGNPRGRPPIKPEFRDRCRRAVDEHVIEAWLNEVATLGEHWVKCSELLANYGYGRPPQPVTGEDGKGPVECAIKIYLPSNGRESQE